MQGKRPKAEWHFQYNFLSTKQRHTVLVKPVLWLFFHLAALGDRMVTGDFVGIGGSINLCERMG